MEMPAGQNGRQPSRNESHATKDTYHKSNQAKAETNQQMKAKMDSHHEKLMMIMKAGKKKTEAIRETCLENTEACLESKQPTSMEVESETKQQYVHKEEAAMETFGALN
jgi:hypothetical protein